VAQVAEVTVSPSGQVRVDRVVCAVDCGLVLHPDIVESQMEGAIAFGLSAALKGGISIARGRVTQANFDTYPLLRMPEMPVVEVYLVPSTAFPGGAGEAGVPPVAPAVCNAVFAATGVRVRRLPIDAGQLAEG
jgi:isoquinoline 1-oxidoreductase beta subunit